MAISSPEPPGVSATGTYSPAWAQPARPSTLASSTAAARTDMLVHNVMHKVARPSADGRHAGVARASVQAQPARCPVTVGKVNSKCASVRCNVFVALRCVCLVTPRLIFARRLDLSQV